MGRKSSGGARKHGRNKDKCQSYKKDNRKEKNKIKKWNKQIKKLPPDSNMRKELERNIKKIESKMYL